ncbi:AAA family ATPase, partial [Aquifex sp.]
SAILSLSLYFYMLQRRRAMSSGESVAGTTFSFGSSYLRGNIKFNEEELYEFLRKRVIGQDEALKKISKKIYLGLKESRKLNVPLRRHILASLLLVGPTGVGKTETAKALEEFFRRFGYSLVRIDMNQFSSEHSVWSLIGSIKGYIGSETPGILTGSLMNNPRRIILFDEIEKAHPKAFDFMLQFIDEGYVVERSTGQKVYADHAIVLMTSNYEQALFGRLHEEIKDPIERDLTARKILEGFFRPELLGRLDDVVVYRNLKEEDILLLTEKILKSYGLNEDPEKYYRKYKPLIENYGVRIYLKKLREDILERL